MIRTNAGRPGAKRGRWLLPVLLSASLAPGAATQAEAQQAPPMRIWAAQTGPNQLTLSWEEVPEAVEYRIYAGDPDAVTDPAARRPISVLSGSGRYATINGVNRASAGLYLEAIGRDRRRRRKVAFNAVTPVRTAQVVTAPAEATATATGPTEVTLSWTPVPGATAYVLGRAVSPGGFQMLCALCSSTPTYVDREATPGAAHSYTVAAVFPSGLSQRTLSNIVTPGAPATVAEGTTTPATGLPSLPTSTAPTAPTTSYTPPGQPAGTTTTYTPPGTPAGTTSTTTTTPTTTPITTPTTATPTTSYLAPLVQKLDSLRTWFGGMTGGALQGAITDTAKYRQLVQQLDTMRSQALVSFGGMIQTVTVAEFTQMQQALTQFTQQLDGLRSSVVNAVSSILTGQVGTQVHAATTFWTGPCRLDYQRADNMWAGFGKPDGQLGTESISLLDGQAKLFFTDWKYEKTRNDGSNYYGSHLRIATNPGARPVRLRIQNALSSGWTTVDAGATKQFQTDLAEVSCTNP